jgi:hypothetical protein
MTLSNINKSKVMDEEFGGNSLNFNIELGDVKAGKPSETE